MRKLCRKCGTEKNIDEFYFTNKAKGIRQSYCKTCAKLYTKDWYSKNGRTREESPERKTYRRKKLLLNKYGLTPEQYESLLINQGGKCAGCKTLYVDGSKSLAVDHDHLCCPGQKSCGKCIRGLLCIGCNIAIGNVRDSPETLENLAKYLRDLDVIKH